MKKYFSSYWIRSAFYTFLQRFSLTFFGLINLMVLLRTLNETQMGVWMLFLIVTTIFETAKTNLLKNAHIRFVSSRDDNPEKTAIASSSLLINIAITGLFIFIIAFWSGWLSSWLTTSNELGAMMIWFIPGLLGMVLFSHLEAVQQSHLDFKGGFAGNFVRQFIFFVIIIFHFAFDLPFSLVDLAIYQSCSIIAGTIVLYIYSKKYLLHRFDPSIVWVKKILGFGGYIFSSGVISSIVANVDQIMIARFSKTTSAVAFYGAAARINLLVDIPSYAASEILFPKAARASQEEGQGKVRYLYEKMVAILLCFTTPAAIFIILFPKLIIGIIAGSAYFAAAPILQLYMLTGILRPMQNQAANLLNSMGKASLCFIMNTISLVINLAINYVCLVNFGFYGAAIGTLITICLISVAWYFVMKKQIGLEMTSVFRNMAQFYKSSFTLVFNFVTGKNKKI